jgi:enamine deaminase RidA (YjgF/YER057c/UK114 family)
LYNLGSSLAAIKRMSAILTAARRRVRVAKPSRRRTLRAPSPLVVSRPSGDPEATARCSRVDLGDSVRLALMVAPRGLGKLGEQLQEVLSAIRTVLAEQSPQMVVTVQTVFLKDARDQKECERAFAKFYGGKLPVTNFVLQPPCSGAALAVEAWAISGKDVRVQHFGRQALAVSYDRLRWIYCAGVGPRASVRGAYSQTLSTLGRLRRVLTRANSSFERVVRTWFYLGGITEPETGVQRYQELNRARTDFYGEIHFQRYCHVSKASGAVYPASTGIGMSGLGLVAGCMALETGRQDVLLLPLENPQQTPAYAYAPGHSPQSPKFSRAVALVLGNYVTTWVSGTASIVDAESRHLDDPEKQTTQTIDNIERLIAANNFDAHGLKGAGARLRDLAKIRVYLKRPQDLAKCRAICEKRFGPVPAVYAVADICRPELLVEIEGVAFSRYSPGRC